MLGDRTCVASLAGSDAKNAQLLARVFQDKFHQYDCSKKLRAQDLPKFPNPGPWDMHSFVRQEARLKEQSCRQGISTTNSINAIVVPKTSQTVFKRWAKGPAGHAWETVLCWRGFHFARRSVHA